MGEHNTWTLEIETDDGEPLDVEALGVLLRANGVKLRRSLPGNHLLAAIQLRAAAEAVELAVSLALPAPEKPVDVPAPELIYFCGVAPGHRAGHHCYPNQREPLTPWGASNIGYTLLDWHPERDGRAAPRLEYRHRGNPEETEGEFVHLIDDGWTLVAAWDRSADKRGGCTASFAMPGEFGPEAALAHAKARWPRVFARIEAHVGRPVTVRRAVVPEARGW